MKEHRTGLGLSCLSTTLFVFLLVGCGADEDLQNPGARTGALLETVSQQTVTRQMIDTAMMGRGLTPLTGPAQCDVDLYKIKYDSLGVNGERVELSAAVSIPRESGCNGPFPLMATGHGTRILKTYTEADPANAALEHGFYTSQGYVSVNVDYVGLGMSDYAFHPYLHRDSQARSIIDGIRAARILCEQRGVQLSGKVMLKGYSQGGHAALAAQREIETKHMDEFELVATAPMSGPYRLEQTVVDGVSPTVPNIGAGLIFAYLIQGYQGVYGNIYTSLEDVFLPAYIDLVQTKFPGDSDFLSLLAQGAFPPDPARFLQPSFLEGLANDPGHPLRVALRANEVLTDFTPQTALAFCGSRMDSIVPFFNSMEASGQLKSAGLQVPVIDVADMVQVQPGEDPGFSNHVQAFALCSAAVKASLFDPVR